MLVYLSLVILIITFLLIIKRYDARITLFLAGVFMFSVVGDPLKAFDLFIKLLLSNVAMIVGTAMGFAAVIHVSRCSDHFSHFILKYMMRYKGYLIPMTVVATWFVSFSIVSPVSLAAAMGPIIIPNLIRCGVHPAIASAAFIGGTWGNFTSGNTVHMGIISNISGTPIIKLVIDTFPASLLGVIITSLFLYGYGKYFKEDSGYIDYKFDNLESDFKVEPLKALMPIIPVILMFATANYNVKTEYIMIISTIIVALVTRLNPRLIMDGFCKGIGDAYAGAMSLVAATSVFVGGLTTLGLTGAIVEYIKTNVAIAKITSQVVPFLIAFISGSGDAATISFNTSITPLAHQLGLNPDVLGMSAHYAGNIGRTASPVAPVAMVIVSIAGITTMETTKRLIIPMILLAFIGGGLILYG